MALPFRTLNELSLFTGAGGGLLGSILLGHRPVCAVEIDPYCREILLQRQRDGVLPLFPIWDDVRTFDGKPWREKVDLVSAGFPCQPFSTAGKRQGAEDSRNLWPETIRIIREVRPTLCLLENVPGLLSAKSVDDTTGRPIYYFGTILRDLSVSGYDARWEIVSAAEVGAPHLRKRLWIVAHDNGADVWDEHGRGNRTSGESPTVFADNGKERSLADSNSQRQL